MARGVCGVSVIGIGGKQERLFWSPLGERKSLDDWVPCRIYNRKEQRSKSGTPVEGSNYKEQEEADKGAVVVKNEDQVLGQCMLHWHQCLFIISFNRKCHGHKQQEEAVKNCAVIPHNEDQVLEIGAVVLPQYSKSFASDGFIVDVQQVEFNNGAVVATSEAGVMENGILPDALNTFMTCPEVDEYILDFEQENVDGGAVEAMSEAQVLKIGIPPPARYQEFDVGALNMAIHKNKFEQVFEMSYL
ncbi:hypothetical protein F3Y22_tig00111772pilonHSYRG00310 [Hibiscus syriacus]|uniref:Uncharacterized protein n=1 Tax=Hibiscus syriacus TaxID=106335 RepID=A0A6A2XEL0_HIBSY|nr:hypothetical protein F3Y22_tig00111772pilonHSYRG00310 [Hibiscus syriacus]